MLVCGLDFETTGLDLKNDRITEVGAVLWDTERGAPVQILSEMMYDKAYPALSEENVALTGITQGDLDTFGLAPTDVIPALFVLMEKADAIVAHNGLLFDKPMLAEECNRQATAMPKKLWIDTTTDIEFPKQIITRRLGHLASDHGFLNPFAHRALFDVCTMLAVAQRYDWQQITKYAMSPTLTIRADVSYHQREDAKKRNYRWNGETKEWTKSIKEFQLEQEKAEAKFNVAVLSRSTQ
jgi:DNA polymerase-3 subunit epsilon